MFVVALKSLDFVSLVSCRLIAATLGKPLVPYRLSSWIDDGILVHLYTGRSAQNPKLRLPDVVISKSSIRVFDKENPISNVDDVHAVISSHLPASKNTTAFYLVDFSEVLLQLQNVTSEDDAYDIISYKTRMFHGVYLDALDMRSNSIAVLSASLARTCYIPCIPHGKSRDGVDFSKCMELLKQLVKIPVVKSHLYVGGVSNESTDKQ